MRASYKAGVEGSAWNDEPTDLDEENIQGQMTIVFLADLFNKEPHNVARDVVAFRKKNNI